MSNGTVQQTHDKDATAGAYGTAAVGVAGIATAGDRGTATAGVAGIATAGDRGTAMVGDCGIAMAGDGGIAMAGVGGIAMAGDGGVAMAGVGGIITLRWWDANARRYRLTVAHIGENGILPNTPYRLDKNHQFTPAKGIAKDPG